MIPYYKWRPCHGTQAVHKGTNHRCLEVHTNHLLLLGDEQIAALLSIWFFFCCLFGFEWVVFFSEFNQVVCFQGLNEIVSKCNAFAIDDCSEAIHMKTPMAIKESKLDSSFQGNLTSYLW